MLTQITYNNIFEFPRENPFRIKMDVFFTEKLIFDEFGNPCLYETPLIEDHVPLKPNRKKKKKKPQDVIIDEVQYVLKHFPGYLEMFRNKGTPKDVYLRFTLEDVFISDL